MLYKKQYLYYLFLSLLIIGVIIFIGFTIFSYSNGYVFWQRFGLDVSGQFGDYVGGVVGTVFALAGTLLIYFSFQEQEENNKRISFESAFFEIIRLHKENVNELSYTVHDGKDLHTARNRKVLKLIYQEFLECYNEIKRVSLSKNHDDYLNVNYKKFLQHLIGMRKLNVDIIEMVIIDVAFCIVYYGLRRDGKEALEKRFSSRYQASYYLLVLEYLSLKPKKENTDCYSLWVGIAMDHVPDVYASLAGKSFDSEWLKQERLKLCSQATCYYGGHQNRLGHYYRNLFQGYKYIDQYDGINDGRKYFYGKMLRAQLSNYEQSLLFINSVSSLGFKWEFVGDRGLIEKDGFITKYKLIKNVLGERLDDILYKKYYPKIQFEYEEIDLN